MHEHALERNKAVVLRFNREVIEQGSVTALQELVAPERWAVNSLPSVLAELRAAPRG